MLIDWFTVIAQIINFLVLLALLKRFLYGPIIAAMDAREQRVVSRLHEAHEQQAQAEQQAAEYRRKQQELEQQRAALLQQAEEAACQHRQELLANARAEADHLRARWRAALQQNRDSFLRDLQQRTGEQVMAIVRRVLGDLADARLEQQIITVFLQRLQNLDPQTQETLQQALAEEQQAAHIRSAFELVPRQREQISSGLQKLFGKAPDLSFETTPELISGVTLRVGGHAVGWNMQSYLETLEEEVYRNFAAEAQAKSSTPPGEQPAASTTAAIPSAVEER